MLSQQILEQIEVTGTITQLSPFVGGKVIISGSHGGELPGMLAFRSGAKAVILNDAGVGLEKSGVGSLQLCQGVSMAAATVSHMSCRIGDGEDMIKRGIISYINLVGIKLGVKVGHSCEDAIKRLVKADQPFSKGLPVFKEYRQVFNIDNSERKLILVDSASMVMPEDKGHVVVTGSHGGLIENNPNLVIKAQVFAAFFNDAGGGIDNSGFTRLAVLDERKIVGIALNCMSCRIGSAWSGYDTGIVSHVNDCAKQIGIEPGMTTRMVIKKL